MPRRPLSHLRLLPHLPSRRLPKRRQSLAASSPTLSSSLLRRPMLESLQLKLALLHRVPRGSPKTSEPAISRKHSTTRGLRRRPVIWRLLARKRKRPSSELELPARSSTTSSPLRHRRQNRCIQLEPSLMTTVKTMTSRDRSQASRSSRRFVGSTAHSCVKTPYPCG